MEKITIKSLEKLSKKDLLGKIIVFPTDTVYGVGCLYEDEKGIEKIYQMKKRDYGKKLPVLCDKIETVKSIAIIDDKYQKYTELWPGALTIILNKRCKNETVAVRIPNSTIAIKVLNTFGPLHTTSVNYSGEKELNSPEEISEIFGDCIDYLVIDKENFTKKPSTIIDCTKDEVIVIRNGDIKITN